MERKNPLEGNPGVCMGASLGCGDKSGIPAVVEGPLESNPLESNPLPKLPQGSAQERAKLFT